MKNVVLFNNAVAEIGPDSSIPIKNKALAERVAAILGGSVRAIDEVGRNKYFIPVDAVHGPIAKEHGICGQDDIYGGVVSELQHADKAMLHGLVSSAVLHPTWYSKAFAQRVGDAVLPGFTVFTREDAMIAFEQLRTDGLAVRFKNPIGSCERGQCSVASRDEIDEVAAKFRNKFGVTGAVFEAYELLGTSIARATFDVVQGIDGKGHFFSGVTDPSIRPSASSPAEIRAIEEFVAYPKAHAVSSRVVYDYTRTGPESGQQELFAEHSRMNIYVQVTNVT